MTHPYRKTYGANFWGSAHHGTALDRRRWRSQGIKVESISREKPACCELCGASADSHARGIVLDHCHATGTFRGWLCGRCNAALGLLGDDAELMERAADYLRRHRAHRAEAAAPASNTAGSNPT